jgi:hypothetical protein
VRKAFFAEVGVKSAKSLSFFVGERPSIGAPGEVDECVDLLWLAVE